jgi:hypothetical protein
MEIVITNGKTEHDWAKSLTNFQQGTVVSILLMLINNTVMFQMHVRRDNEVQEQKKKFGNGRT